MYCPAGHGVHAESGGTKLYVPGAHDVHAVAPMVLTILELVPGEQSAHELMPSVAA